MLETKNTIIYNRHKDDISLIHNHTNIPVEEIIIGKKSNAHSSLDFKSTNEERKQKIFWDLKITRKNDVIWYRGLHVYQHYNLFLF